MQAYREMILAGLEARLLQFKPFQTKRGGTQGSPIQLPFIPNALLISIIASTACKIMFFDYIHNYQQEKKNEALLLAFFQILTIIIGR